MLCQADSVFHSFSTVESTANGKSNSTFPLSPIGEWEVENSTGRKSFNLADESPLFGEEAVESDTRRGAKRTSPRWSDDTFWLSRNPR